jgi:predicted GNAT family N-acyltransferase
MVIEYKQIGMDDKLYQLERDLRNEILLRPIGIPDYGWEMHDRDSLHFVAVKDQRVVGCVLLYIDSVSNQNRLMQMAVTSEFQRHGVGRQLVGVLLATAKSRKIGEIVCHARADAVDFYRKVNFEIFGEAFEEAGVLHFHMRHILGSDS